MKARFIPCLFFDNRLGAGSRSPASDQGQIEAELAATPGRGVRQHDLCIRSRSYSFSGRPLHAGIEVARGGHSTFTLTLDVYGDYIPVQVGGAPASSTRRFGIAS